jgi:hypothetical protein
MSSNAWMVRAGVGASSEKTAPFRLPSDYKMWLNDYGV